MSDTTSETGTDEGDRAGRCALQAWRAIEQTPELVAYFKGVFDVAAIVIEETGEELTLRITDDKIEIEPGLPETPDFRIPLQWENVENMVRHAEGGRIEAREAWRIMAVLFTPLTRETLKNPMMSSGLLRMLNRIENLIHIHLLHPDGEDSVMHTLVHVNGEWLVCPGLHGTPRRVFRMTPDDCIEYQRKVFAAIKADRTGTWWSFGGWYRDWRRRVSTRA